MRKGLLTMSTALDDGMKSKAKISSMKPKKDPKTLWKAKRDTSLGIEKGEMPLSYIIRQRERHAIRDL